MACSTPAGERFCSATPIFPRPSKRLRNFFRRWKRAPTSPSAHAGCAPKLRRSASPLHRQLFGRIFNLILRLTLGLKFKDTQCGFKAFRQAAVQTIFPLQKIERWGFDPEILFLARKFNFKVQEVPVAWGHSGGTRINPLVDGSRMILEMLRIRWYDLTGKYTLDAAPAQSAKAMPQHRGPQS